MNAHEWPDPPVIRPVEGYGRPQFPSPYRGLLETRQPPRETLASSSSSLAAAAMGLWNYGRKGTHDREAGSLLGRRRGSVKEEAASPPRQAMAPFSIAPRSGAGHHDR
ncbi:ADP-ribosylation factor-related protein 1 [Hordeum vulgare]|nr:ADP-ribosylation factor-related protein 1 [Hordeum vulgare]